jgi:hypothetical protein
VVVGELLLGVRGKLRNSLRYLTLDSSTVFTSVIVDELFLSAMGELTNRLPLLESCTVFTAVAICQQLLTLRGQFRNNLPDVGVLYNLDSCGYWSATSNRQGTVQEQLT